MNVFLINIALAMIWAALTGNFNPLNILLGFGLGYLILYIVRGVLGPTDYFAKVGQLIGFIGFFLWEVLIANLRVARRVLSSHRQMHPRVIAVPLETCNEAEIALIANFISLTPGTLSLDVSSDRCTLYVHVMDAPDPEAARQEIKQGFERRVLELFRRNVLPPRREG